MRMIVNTTVVKKLAISLGWDNLSIPEMQSWLKESGIDPVGVLLFMQAINDNPRGVDDTTIEGVNPGQLPYIEDWFREKGYVF